MSATENKYRSKLGDLVEYDYEHYDRTTWERTKKPVLLIPIAVEKLSGWWFYRCQVIGKYDFVHAQDQENYVRVACKDLNNTGRKPQSTV